MRISSLALFTLAMMISAVASATIWYAGSGHSGKVLAPVSDSVSMVWHCDGKVCESEVTDSQTTTKDVCNGLVKKIGKITYITDKKGIRWSPMSEKEKLRACNKSKLR